VTARYKTVDLRLHPADPTASHYLEWQAQVGFIGGWHSYGPQHAQRQIRQTAPNLLAGNTHPASKGPVTTNSEPTAEVTQETIRTAPDSATNKARIHPIQSAPACLEHDDRPACSESRSSIEATVGSSGAPAALPIQKR